jgi:hypothetical protein
MSDDDERRNYSDEEGEDVGFDDSDRDDDSEEDEEDDEEEMKRVSTCPFTLRHYLLRLRAASRQQQLVDLCQLTGFIR